MTNPKHTSSDLVEWCSQDLPCARYQALEAENERLTARVAELKEALASMVEYSRYNEFWQDRHPEYVERARAALETKHD